MLNANFSNKTQLKNNFYFLFYWVRSGSMYFVQKNLKKRKNCFRQNFQKYKKIWKKEKTVFIKTFKNTKKFEKKKKLFLSIRPSVSKLKNHIVFFHTPKNNVLACILALITSLLKSREHWPKFQKTTKNLFCLSLSIRGMTLHVMRIPDI